MIEARQLRKVYGHTVAVDGIDFQVKPGEWLRLTVRRRGLPLCPVLPGSGVG
jgi:ABC-type uncharacterized transport system ATPase subunit